MDNAFPHSLFPRFYSNGPSGSGGGAEAATVLRLFGDWGTQEHAQPLGPAPGGGEQEGAELKWLALRSSPRERWEPLEPVAVPLLPPNKVSKYRPATLEDLSYVGNIIKSREDSEVTMCALNFPEQMAYFFLEHRDDAFGSMGKLLEESFYFGDCTLKGKARDKAISVNFLTTFTERVKQRECPISNLVPRARLLSHFLGESMFDIPPDLLAENIHEEMNFQRNQLLFNHSATGGALVYQHFSEGSHCEEGCLMYPSADSMSSLNFRKIKISFDDNKIPKLNAKFKPARINLNGRIHQIACSEVEKEVFVGVRSDYYCGAWKLSKSMKPTPLRVVQIENVATCVNVSPHLPGELMIASECGAAYLWNVDKGLQRIRKETENLNFNAQLPWRWCDFTAHPRVYLYADRTGLDLTDLRAGESCNQTLFKMGAAAYCQRGERVILPKHLHDVHPFHYLITTQYSAYIVDERFPIVPVLKWNHMLGSPPLFAQVVSGASRNETNKIVLGTQRTQEALLLQYSGGTQLPCQSFGPPQKLSSNYDMLNQLPMKLLLRQEALVTERLHSPGAGIAALYHRNGRNSLSVIQLSAAGDLFYQTLVPRKNACNEENATTERVRNDSEHMSPAMSNRERSEDPSGHIDHGHVDGDGEGKGSEETSPPLTTDKEGPPSLSSQGTRKPTLSRAALVTCRRWLKSFLTKQKRLNTNSNVLPKHRLLNIKHMFACETSDEPSDEYKEMRDRIKSVMEKREILSHSTLPTLDPVSVPEPIDPSVWKDDLSDRLTAAWEGKWSEWWSEKLGVNHDKRIKVLLAKRKSEKSARARHRRGLSGSFTSSVSEFSDFTDASVWSTTSAENLKESDWLSDTESHTLLNRSTAVSRVNGNIILEQEKEVQPSAEGNQQSMLDPTPSLEIQLGSVARERKGILQKYIDALEENSPLLSEQDDEMSSFKPITTSTQIPLMSTPHVQTNCVPFLPRSSQKQPLPSHSQCLPSHSQPLPSHSQPLPSHSPPQLTHSQPLLFDSQPLPSLSQPLSSHSQILPSLSQPLDSLSQSLLSASQSPPSQSQSLFSQSQLLFSQSQSLPSLSQSMVSLSQSVLSQPKKKRARMGF